MEHFYYHLCNVYTSLLSKENLAVFNRLSNSKILGRIIIFFVDVVKQMK